jgi:hypothetical protein
MGSLDRETEMGRDSAAKKIADGDYLWPTGQVFSPLNSSPKAGIPGTPDYNKHPVLLPVGEKAQFRLTRNKMELRAQNLDDKNENTFVVTMTPCSMRSRQP